jgi:hypothetical protein
MVVYTLLLVGFGGGIYASASTPTAVTLALTSGGTTVTTVASGSVLTLTATVKVGSTGVTVGQVKFCDAAATYCTDIHLLGTAQLTSNGTATLKFVPGIGNHSYKAIFVGTTSYAASVSSVTTVSVSPAGRFSTTTTLLKSGTAGSYTLTATVVGSANTIGLTSPNGTVSFLDASNGNDVLGTAVLGTGTAGITYLESSIPVAENDPDSIVIGDFNGDGIPDLAIANEMNGTITVLLGNGNGTFTPTPVSPSTGFLPWSLAVGDFNGDGKVDLAVVNFATSSNNDAGTVTVLLGNGDGTFQAAASLTTGICPNSIAVGDFNGDGKTDLAVVNGGDGTNDYAGTVTVLLGNGDGTFTAAVSPATGRRSDSVAVGDFNGDGIPDLAIANESDNTITVLLGNGNGTFTITPVSPSTGYSPSSIVVGDFNGDGKADLATGYGGAIAVLLGNGDGTFAVPVLLPTGYVTGPIAVGDFNGDGKADLAIGAMLLLGNGDGTFVVGIRPTIAADSVYAIAVGDLNGDGNADLAFANFSNNTVSVLLTQLSQTVLATATGISPDSPGDHSVLASYPGDNNFASSFSNTTVLYEQPPTTTTSLALTSAGAPLTTVASGSVVTLTATVRIGGRAVTVGQVNFCDASATFCTDTHLLGTAQLTSNGTATLNFVPGIGEHSYRALFIANVGGAASPSSASVLTVTGSLHPSTTSIVQSGSVGNYTLTATVVAAGATPPTGLVSFLDTSDGNSVLETGILETVATGANLVYSLNSVANGASPEVVAVGDFNRDGKADLAVADSGNYLHMDSGTVKILLGNGDGTFAMTASLATGVYPIAIAIADLNGDGIPDLAVANRDSSTLSILLGNGDGTFATPTSVVTGINPTSITAGDFNGDGKMDLAVANSCGSTPDSNCGTYLDPQGTLTILLGNGDGTFTQAANETTDVWPASVAVGDFNGDGKPDLAVANECGKSGLCSAKAPGTVTILLGVGEDGTFTPAATPAAGVYPTSIAVGDFNGDGKPDLAVANSNDNTVTVLLGNGDGTFEAAASPATGVNPTSIAVGDFNGDGKTDLVVANGGNSGNGYAGTVTILLGNGDGTFEAAANPATGRGPVSIAVGDFTADGETDLALANSRDIFATVLLAQLTQASIATVTSISPVGTGTHQVEASYSGDSSYSSSVSSTTGLTAQPVSVAASPTFSPAAGTYNSSQTVTISDVTPGATIYYTTNGIPPTIGSALYSGAIAVSSTETIEAIATATGYSTSVVAIATYTINLPAASTPTFSVASGTYSTVQTISISDATSGTTIYYTTDGTTPTPSSTKFTGPITVSSTETIKAIASATGFSTSAVATATYTINLSAAATPTFSPAAGTYTSAQTVTISDTTPSATIYYTTDGTVPTTSSTKYTASVNVSTTENLEAIAMAPGYSTSAVATAAYTITPGSPALTLSTNSLSFGVVVVQTGTSNSSQTMPITATNTGTADLSISTITIGGTNPSDFAVISDTCSGTTVAPNTTCVVNVKFTPATTASRSATLTVSSNSSAPQTANLTGTGMNGFRQCDAVNYPKDVPVCFDNNTNMTAEQCGAAKVQTLTCSFGCALTSLGDVLSTFSSSSTPESLDDYLKSTPDKYLPAGTGNMNWCAIPDSMGGSVQWFDGTSLSSKSDLNTYLTKEIATKNRIVILELCDTNVTSLMCHYIAITGQGTSDWIVFDPGWSGAYDSILDCQNGKHDDALLTSLNAHLNGITVKGNISGCVTHSFSVIKNGRALGPAVSKNAQCVSALSPVELLISDPSGNQIGSTGQGDDIHSIASASYWRDFPILDAQGSNSALGEATGIKTAYIPSAADGKYVLTATGTGFGQFTLGFHSVALDGSAQDATVTGLAGVGSTATYQVSYSTQPGVPTTITRSASGPSAAVSNNSVQFGSQLIRTTSSPFIVTLGSTGGTALQGLNLSVSSGFGQSSNCTSSLAPNGTCTINMTFSPSTVGPSTGTLTISSNAPGSPLNVALTGTGTAPTPTTPTVSVTPSSSSITTAQALTVTVAVGGGTGNPTPTGSVTLTGGGYTSSAATLTSGSVTINIPAGSLAAGSDTLTVSYTPDSNSSSTYNGASGSNTVTVTTVVSPSFTISGAAVSIAKGATTGNTSTITVTPSGGFTGSVALTATITSNPAGAQYLPTLSFGSTTPVGITGPAAGTATLTISTTAATSAALVHPKRPGVPWYAAGGATLACLLLFGIPVRRRSWRTMLGLLVLLVSLAGGVLSCGGGGGSGGGGGGNPGTTAGTYTVTVTGTASSLTETTTVAVNVN